MAPDVKKHTGLVAWFNEPKGFGFITDDDSGQDILVTHDAIERDGFPSLAPGEKVGYTLEERKGGPKAAKVWLIG